MGKLVALGVKLSMDDLGSGYSSLQRLSALPFSTIKADQALLVRFRDNPIQTMSMIRTIIQMGHDLDRAVVVEGLEHMLAHSPSSPGPTRSVAQAKPSGQEGVKRAVFGFRLSFLARLDKIGAVREPY